MFILLEKAAWWVMVPEETRTGSQVNVPVVVFCLSNMRWNKALHLIGAQFSQLEHERIEPDDYSAYQNHTVYLDARIS